MLKKGEQRYMSAGAYFRSVTKGLPRRISENGHRKGQKSSKTEGPGKGEKLSCFDPRLPAIQPIQLKHWRSMTGEDSYLKEVFEQPPLTAFRRQNN